MARAAAGFEARGWAVSPASSVFIGECSLDILTLRFSTTSITSALSHKEKACAPLVSDVASLTRARAALFLPSLLASAGHDGNDEGGWAQQEPEHPTGVPTGVPAEADGTLPLTPPPPALWAERALILARSCWRSSAKLASPASPPSGASTPPCCMSAPVSRVHEAPATQAPSGKPPPSSGEAGLRRSAGEDECGNTATQEHLAQTPRT